MSGTSARQATASDPVRIAFARSSLGGAVDVIPLAPAMRMDVDRDRARRTASAAAIVSAICSAAVEPRGSCLDVGNAGRELSSCEIAPGNSDRHSGAACEIDATPVVREWYFLDHAIPPYPADAVAESKRFDQGPCGAGTHWSPRVERENEVGCVGQGLFEHGGDAIGGNDIEPRPRTDHDTSGLCSSRQHDGV